MTRKENNNKKTDQAWSALYSRLEKDGLIVQTKAPRSSLRLTAFKWTAAAVILICTYLSISYFNLTEKESDQNLLTRQNMETTTLATTLEDGSIVYLAGNAAIHYPEHFQADKREISLQGNALFDITGNRTRPFFIQTIDTRIEVLGTAFNVKSNDTQPFELSVQRGVVKVTLKNNGQDVYVKAGETATIASHKLQVEQTKHPEQFSEYTRQIHFKDERLANILHIINLNTENIHLQTIPALEDRKLTVTFSNNSPEDIAELICGALNLKYSRDKNVLTLHEN